VALEQLLAAMGREAEARSGEIHRSAVEESARITALAEARITARRQTVVDEERARLREETNRLLAAERRRGREEVLRLRQEALDQVRAAARARLPAAQAGAEYRESIAPALLASLEYLDGGAATLRVSPALQPELTRAAAGLPRWKLTVEPDPGILAGFVTAAGGIRVDQTLEHRLDTRWPGFSMDLAHRVEHPE